MAKQAIREAGGVPFELILQEELGAFTSFFDVLDLRSNVNYNEDGHKRPDAMLKVMM